jgi:glycosyltransferase involved in cell wall biosynthesis
MPSQILMVASGTGFNGAIKYCYELVVDFRQQGVDVLPVCIPGSWLSRHFDKAGIEYVASPLSRFPLTELKRVATLARERGVSVVHTHNSRAHSFGVLLKLLHGLPVVATAHQRHIQLHWCMNDYVIANSDVTLRSMRRFNWVPKSRIRRVYCPINDVFFDYPEPNAVTAARSSWGLSTTDLVIGCVGNVSPRKSQLNLIRAFPGVLRAFPQARLLMVGDDHGDYAETCRQAVQELGLQNAVRWLGHQDNVPRLMNCMDVCVCTPTEEAFGLTAAEALASGVPVIATRVGGLREIVIDDATGLLVSPNAPDELSAAITRLLKDKTLRARFGNAGRQRVQTLFNAADHRAQLLDVYQTVARNKRPGK